MQHVCYFAAAIHPMRRILFILVFLLPVLLHAQNQPIFNVNSALTNNDLFPGIDSNWRFINADDTAMAAPDYNDSSWAIVNPALKGDSNIHLLKGIGWFRKKIYVTDSIKDLSLVIAVSHYGASEIYLDGKRIDSHGLISKSADSVEYINPVNSTLFFHFDDTGMHTIAVRFANYRDKAPFNPAAYAHGFYFSITEANNTHKQQNLLYIVTFGVFLFGTGMFLMLAGLHLLLWLFHYKDKSNLFLSILCMILAIFCSLLIYWTHSEDPDMFIVQQKTNAVLFSLALAALSALLNNLFGSFRWRFFLIQAICLLSIILSIYKVSFAPTVFNITIIIVMLESIILVIHAIRKKVKGARVLAIGVLPLAFSTLILYALQLAYLDNQSFNQEPTGVVYAVALLFGFLFAVSVAGIPISMSAFLAWRFATINKDLTKQLTHVQELSEKTQQQEAEKKRILENQKAQLEKEVTERTSEIVEEKKKSDELLLNILPEEVARELKETGHTTAHQYDRVTVMFTDFVDFTILSEQMDSQELVEELHNCFKAFDAIMSKHGIEKIKTIGDAYLAVCGLPLPDEHHAEKVVTAAKEICAFMQERRRQLGEKTFEVRIGIHSGEVVAGIVGVKKFAYDIWGDTVNTAARMESKSKPGKINISQTTYDLVKDKYTCTYRGEIEAKNKGMLKMYFVEE